MYLVDIGENFTHRFSLAYSIRPVPKGMATTENPIASLSNIYGLVKDLPEVDLSLIKKDIDAANALLLKGVSYDEVSREIAQTCSFKSIIDPQWGLLAGRVLIAALKRNAPKTFSECAEVRRNSLGPDYLRFVLENAKILNLLVDEERDMRFDYLAAATLLKSFLGRVKKGKGKFLVVETPQYMFLRSAVYKWYPDIIRIQRAYDDLSLANYSDPSPTLFNSGTKVPQLASCFLTTVSDCMDGITKSWKDLALISMNSGGIGCDVSSLRHSEIGEDGESKGIVPWIKIKNEILACVDQRGHRKGSGTMYLRDWHVDAFEFAVLRDEGPDNMRARDLFYAFSISDLFMRRVLTDGVWSLFCPNKAKGLPDKWGTDFEMAYEEYERQGIYERQVRARDLWKTIIDQQIKTGMPFIIYIDAINRKCNQKHSGMVHSSNLCVSGDTYILTDCGNRKIGEIVDETVTIWNGEEWSPVTVRKTGAGKDLIRVTFTSGAYLECTPEHNFYIALKDQDTFSGAGCKKISATELRLGDRLIDYKLPGGGYVRKTYVSCIEGGKMGVDTFCFTEKKRGMGLFNGVLTGQCLEITEVTSEREIANCNLSSVSLSSCVENGEFNFEKLERVTADLVRNINQVIDRNYYDSRIPEIRYSNFRHRPLGIGVQGLADAFALMKISWVKKVEGNPSTKWELDYVVSPEAQKLNHDIFETMYYAAVRETIQMAKEYGKYETFYGSPASKGYFQFDLWEKERDPNYTPRPPNNSRYTAEQWELLRRETIKYGWRNSLLLALMPTATSAQILSNAESFEPPSGLIFARTVLSGQFLLVNKHMVRDLKEINLWNTETVRNIFSNNGSMQALPEPEREPLKSQIREIKMRYRTVYEIPQKVLMQLSLERGRFICQTQSMNCHMRLPTYAKLNAYHFYAWKGGAKTGMYYLRQTSASDPINFALSAINIPDAGKKRKAASRNVVCTDEVCTSCSA